MIAALLLAVLAGAGPAAPPALSGLDPAASALLAAEAERIDLAKRPEVATRLTRERTRLAVEQFLKDKAGATPPSEEEIRAALHATTDSAKLQVVVLAQREEARGAMERLRKGASLAEESKASIEPLARTRGGEMGWVTARAIPPEVVKDVFSGHLDTWGGPYDVGGKFFVVRVTDRKVVDTQSDQATLSQVRARLTQERQEAARASLIRELHSKATIQVDEPFLKAAVGAEVTAAARSHVVATVGTGKITFGEVLDSLGTMDGHGQAARSEAMLQVATRQLASRLVVEQAALRAKYDRNAAVKKAFEPVKREILVAAYWDDVSARTPAPTSAEVEARYRERAKEYELPASRQCTHLLVATEEEATRARARITGGEPFDAVARQVTLDGETKDRGGDLGAISEEKLKHLDSALATAIRQLPSGTVSDPARSKQGWHLFVCQTLPARVPPLSEVQDRIAASIRKERISATVNGRVAQLESAAAAKGAKAKASP
jgi:parvulin-like peptidyl-prolyl isomerase